MFKSLLKLQCNIKENEWNSSGRACGFCGRMDLGWEREGGVPVGPSGAPSSGLMVSASPGGAGSAQD